MSKQILFSTGAGLDCPKIAFVSHADITSLPDRPGLFALIGTRGSDRNVPLYFGYADRSMRDQVPYDRGFAHAIRNGLVGFASAYLPGGEDPQALVAALAEAHDAPVNAKANALRDIEAAQSELQAMASARRMAAQ
ncbi:hypothetical protein [Pseudooceanicola onchidii]|uniref:hypothetical protein n=1 Tax=Pseudooceanicola onchidii TaxID=2562279 RepID=UPI0010A9CBB7|nr:hypothetical protein [Pseudooceanicola onchidii]